MESLFDKSSGEVATRPVNWIPRISNIERNDKAFMLIYTNDEWVICKISLKDNPNQIIDK